MRLKKNSPRGFEKYCLFLWPTLVFAAVLVSFLLVLGPKINDILASQRKLASRKKELAQVAQKLAALEGLDEAELAGKTTRVLALLPAEKNIPLWLTTIRALAELTGVNLLGLGVKPGAIAPPSGQRQAEKISEASPLAFEITIEGPQASVRDFLGKIESVTPLMKIEEVSVSRKGAGASAKFSLNVFYLPLPETLEAAERPLPKITAEEDKVYEVLKKIETLPSVELELAPMVSGKENPFTLYLAPAHLQGGL